MTEVLINLKDVEYLHQVKDFIEDKKEYSVWDIVSKEVLLNIIESDILKENNIRIVITDSDNKEMIENLSIPENYYFIYVSDNLSFKYNSKRGSCILKTLNYDKFILLIDMFERLSNITTNDIVIDYKLNYNYDELKRNLNKELVPHYDSATQLFKDKDYIIVQGNKSTGKTYISKLLTENSLYVMFDKNTSNIEDKMFGDIFNSKDSYNFIAKPIHIIIDDFDMLDEKFQIRIIGAIKYRIYNKNNDNKQLPVRAKFILNYKDEPKVIKRFGLNNTIMLPEVNTYSPLNKISIIYNIISPEGKIGIQKQALDYIESYDYSIHGLECLEDIGQHIKKVLKGGDTIKTDYLPYWITNKNYCNELGSSELRKIVDENIFDLKDVEYLVVKGAFKKTLFKKEETAKLLGVTVATLNKKLRTYGLKAKDLMEE